MVCFVLVPNLVFAKLLVCTHRSERMTGVTLIREERRASASHKTSDDQTDDILERLKEDDSGEKLPEGVAKMMANSFFERRKAETKKTK